MNQQRKMLLFGSGLLAVLAGQAVAQRPTAPAQKPPLLGSIALPHDTHRETDEPLAYQSLATVTLERAVTAAQQVLGASSTPSSVQLDNKNGFLIWEVTLGDQAVWVDAGNAQACRPRPLASPK